MSRLNRLLRRPDADQTREVNSLLSRLAHTHRELDRARLDLEIQATLIASQDKDLEVLKASAEHLSARLQFTRAELDLAHREAGVRQVPAVTPDGSLRARLARADRNLLTYEDRLAAYEGRPSAIACPRTCCTGGAR